ncbi:hypothetical protein FRC08_009794 [Ceratobasidium sp. 394]|nr:hypothetical protein FRC08_009794 [Ceratobasidium sp. 394]
MPQTQRTRLPRPAMMATVAAIAISASVIAIGAAHTTVHVARPTSAASADIIVIARRILGEGTDMGAVVKAIRATITRAVSMATTTHNPLGSWTKDILSKFISF